jgi:hypothetical protein
MCIYMQANYKLEHVHTCINVQCFRPSLREDARPTAACTWPLHWRLLQLQWTVRASKRSSELPSELLGLLAPTTCHIAMMITVKDDATTTMTMGRTISSLPIRFLSIDKYTSNIYIQFFAMMFLRKCPRHDYSPNNLAPCILSPNNFLLNGLPISSFSYFSFSEPTRSLAPPHTYMRSVQYVLGGRQ